MHIEITAHGRAYLEESQVREADPETCHFVLTDAGRAALQQMEASHV